MSYSAAAIRTAIKNLLEGSIGSVRVIEADVMLSGVFEGQSDQARKAKTLHTAEHRFDVRIGRLSQHEASPVSAIGSYALKRADIFIDVTTKTATQVQLTERDDVLANVLSDCEQAAQSLGYPANVAQTAALAATGIVSGLLTGPGGEGSPVVEEPQQDWEKQEIRTRISAGCILRIRQNVIVDSEPLEIFGASISGWWRADNLNEASALITSWTDNSEHGFALTPPGAQSLIVDATGLLDFQSVQSLGSLLPGYRVGGTHAFLDDDDAPSVFVVGRFTAVDIGSVTRFFRASLDGNTHVVSCLKTALDRIAMQVGVTTVTTATSADTSAHLFQMLHDGTSARIRVDDVAATVGSAALAGVEGNTVAIPDDSGAQAPFEYLEVLLLNSYPTAAQITAYRQYVVDRYGLSITP